jgi:aminoglycoside 6'-N-acetyltransferase
MGEADLANVTAWLREPHVARWGSPGRTPETQVEQYRRRIAGQEPVTMLTVVEAGQPIGWCQWYRWADYPNEATAMHAEAGDIGIDYVIGERTATGRGVGTALVHLLIEEIRRVHGPAGILVAPEATNAASRRVLEKNGFELVEVRPVATEPTDAPMAIYRKPVPAPRLAVR